MGNAANPKPEARNPKANPGCRSWFLLGSRPSVFFPISEFGFRISLLLALLLPANHALAQYVDIWQNEELIDRPIWAPTLKYIKTDVEAEHDRFRSSFGGNSHDTSRLYISPALGISWDNYIYHPYLMTYSALFEPGYVILQNRSSSATTETDQLRLDGQFTANLLQIKPYATTLTFNRAHDEIKYDVFSSALVDSQGYGVSTGYREGPVPVTLSYQRVEEESTGLDQKMTTDEDLLTLHARNERGKENLTDFNYQFGKFQRGTDVSQASYRSENSYQYLSLNDLERYRRSSLRSSVLFYDIESAGSSSQNLNASLNYNLELAPRLSTYQNYTLSWSSAEGSDSIENYASAGIQHQLYESLSSSFELHGFNLQNSSPGSSLDWNSAGFTGTIDYSKHLGGWGRLELLNSSSFNLNQQDVTGSQLVIANESHIVPNTGLIRLNQPRQIAVNTVTLTNGVPLIEGSDYSVVTTTDPWQIQIISFGPNHVQPGSVVLITYTVESNPSGNYSTWANNAQINFRFWQERINLFGRYGFADNQASSPEFLLEDYTEWEGGAEFNWQGVALRADYLDHRGTLYSSRGYNLSEGYVRNVSGSSTLGINLDQQWITYSSGTATTPSEPQHLTYYDFMGHFDWHPLTRVNWSLEAGYRQQRGLGFDQDLFAVRTYLNWAMGKLEVRLGYEHEARDLTSEKQLRDFGFLRVRRNF